MKRATSVFLLLVALAAFAPVFAAETAPGDPSTTFIDDNADAKKARKSYRVLMWSSTILIVCGAGGAAFWVFRRRK